MPRRSTMTIAGLYAYDPTIFDNFFMPSYVLDDGTPVLLNKQTLIDNLIADLGELELVYPDGDMMKTLIFKWSMKMNRPWCVMYKYLDKNYEALNNYDRTETKKDTENGSNSTSSSDSSTGSNANKRAGFNSTTMVDSDRTDTSMSGTASARSSNQIIKDYTLRAYGNIGVTTTQAMLEAEMKLRQTYNIYDIVINDFKDKFCLMIY